MAKPRIGYWCSMWLFEPLIQELSKNPQSWHWLLTLNPQWLHFLKVLQVNIEVNFDVLISVVLYMTLAGGKRGKWSKYSKLACASLPTGVQGKWLVWQRVISHWKHKWCHCSHIRYWLKLFTHLGKITNTSLTWLTMYLKFCKFSSGWVANRMSIREGGMTPQLLSSRS